MNDKKILVHYINIGGKSNVRAKQLLASYISSVKSNSEDNGTIDYFVPIKEGDSRIEYLGTDYKKALSLEDVIDGSSYKSKIDITLDYYVAKYNFEEFNKKGSVKDNNAIELDINHLRCNLQEVHDKAYMKIFEEKPPLGVSFNAAYGNAIAVWVDLDAMKIWNKVLKKSEYYLYLAEIEKMKDQ